MYKLHLILKYLRKRRIAWVSLIAVMLCTTMVLVVISVMGGWLRMFRESFPWFERRYFHRVAVRCTGFGNYQQMIDQIDQLPEVEAAVPVIRTFGLMKINRGSPDAVQVLGYPADIGKVNNFPQSLHRQYEVPEQEAEDAKKAGKPAPDLKPATQPSFALLPDVPYEDIRPNDKQARQRPGMIVGAGVVGIGKDKNGDVQRPLGLYDAYVRLEVMGLSGDEVSLEGAKPTPNYYWIVDDSRTQIWQFDSKTVYVPFDVLQKDLGMKERVAVNPDTNEKRVVPARTTDIHIKAKPGVDLYPLKNKIVKIVGGFYPDAVDGIDPPIAVETWEEANKTWLGAVEKEKTLVTLLFAMISIVAIFLIFCIFYMIVVENTRDIGIIKSVGATSEGVAGIFLGYGLTIGIIGSALGLLFGYLIVHNINFLHEQMHHLTRAYACGIRRFMPSTRFPIR